METNPGHVLFPEGHTLAQVTGEPAVDNDKSEKVLREVSAAQVTEKWGLWGKDTLLRQSLNSKVGLSPVLADTLRLR